MTIGKPFQKGMKRLGGRRPGSRNKISEAFLCDLHAEWLASGADALKIMAKEDPSGFVKVTAALLPKEFEITQTQLAEIPDEELNELRDELKRRIEQRREFTEGPRSGDKQTTH
jgi:predicted HTH domain antitoxin